MAKNQNNTKAVIALVLMLSGILSIIAAIIINGSVIVSQVGWFGAAQLNNFGALQVQPRHDASRSRPVLHRRRNHQGRRLALQVTT